GRGVRSATGGQRGRLELEGTGPLELELACRRPRPVGDLSGRNRLSRSQACLQLETLAAGSLAGTFHLPTSIGGSETHGALERYECRTRLSARTLTGAGRGSTWTPHHARDRQDQRGSLQTRSRDTARQRGAGRAYHRIRRQ